MHVLCVNYSLDHVNIKEPYPVVLELMVLALEEFHLVGKLWVVSLPLAQIVDLLLETTHEVFLKLVS